MSRGMPARASRLFMHCRACLGFGQHEKRLDAASDADDRDTGEPKAVRAST